MAAKTYRLANATVNGYQQLLESDQTAATLATGWTVAKTAAGNSSEMLVGTERAANTFSSNATTPKPTTITAGSPNAFRSDQPITGEFANANWSIVVAFRSVTVAYSGTIRARVRVFRSANADGSAATELTSATQVGTTTAAGSTTADTTSTVTWAPGAILPFNNEYLFITVACEIVTASGSNSADALLRSGTSTTGTRIVTSNLTTLDADTLALALTPSASETQTFQYTDSATEAFGLTPSVVELAEFADSTTEVLAFTITASELAEFADASEHYLTLTPSGSDVYTPGAAGTEYTDAGTEYLALTPSAADVAQLADANELYFRLRPRKTIRSISDDFNDNSIDTSIWDSWNNAIEQNQRLELTGASFMASVSDFDFYDGIVSIDLVGGTYFWLEIQESFSFSDFYAIEYIGSLNVVRAHFQNGSQEVTETSVPIKFRIRESNRVLYAEYTVNGTNWITVNSQSTDAVFPTYGVEAVYFEIEGSDGLSAYDNFEFHPGVIEYEEVIEANQTYLALIPSGTELHEIFDFQTESLALTPSAIETTEYVDQATETLIFIPSGVDIRELTDSDTEAVALTVSGSELAQYVDSSTEPLALVPSSTEQFAGTSFDVGTGIVSLVPSATDIIEYVDSGLDTLVLTVSGTDVLSTEYSDSGQEDFTLTVSGTDTLTKEYSDDAIETFTLLPSGVEVVEYTDLETEVLLLAPSGTDEHAGQLDDAATVLITFTPSVYELRMVVQLIGKITGLRYEGTVAFQRYWSKAREPL